ncbi:MAG TPA: antibiotic biosynthesis monooxygenase, partial [Rhodocyclaceae bacterium]|nr:antibiotic biosynthesis monooxygenase [Rhodocyclaceae bacterium]
MNTPAAPVMRIARRRAKPGCAEAYVALVQGMFADARQLPGFLGAELIAPAEDDGEYQVVFRFNTQSDMDR